MLIPVYSIVKLAEILFHIIISQIFNLPHRLFVNNLGLSCFHSLMIPTELLSRIVRLEEFVIIILIYIDIDVV